MMRKLKLLGLPILIGSMILGGCTKIPDTSQIETQLTEKVKEIENLVTENSELKKVKEELQKEVDTFKNKLNTQEGTPNAQLQGPSANVLATSLEVIELIKAKDMATLSSYIHPSQGLRLTPYFYIDPQSDQIFTAQEVAGLDQNTTAFNWGRYDGSGEVISLTFNDYYDTFIYDEDFISPQLIGNNVPIGSGNTLDNVAEVYPNGHFIEFHFTGMEPQFEGIDWRSLRLVFEQDNGLWYLVGIVHGQWTI